MVITLKRECLTFRPSYYSPSREKTRLKSERMFRVVSKSESRDPVHLHRRGKQEQHFRPAVAADGSGEKRNVMRNSQNLKKLRKSLPLFF